MAAHAPGPTSTDPATSFEPRRLDPRALQVHVTRGMRDMPPDMRGEVIERESRMAHMHDVLTPRTLGHARRYVAGAVICLPLVNFLVSPAGFTRLWAQVLVAVLYGLAAGFTRLKGSVGGILFMGAGIVSVQVTGYTLLAPCYGNLLALMLYYLSGVALGFGEDLARDER